MFRLVTGLRLAVNQVPLGMGSTPRHPTIFHAPVAQLAGGTSLRRKTVSVRIRLGVPSQFHARLAQSEEALVSKTKCSGFESQGGYHLEERADWRLHLIANEASFGLVSSILTSSGFFGYASRLATAPVSKAGELRP